MTDRPRRAAWADESTQNPDGTFYVAACEENRPGFWRLNSGWQTLEAAHQEAERVNRIFGTATNEEIIAIRTSSMAEENAGWKASDEAILYGDTDLP